MKEAVERDMKSLKANKENALVCSKWRDYSGVVWVGSDNSGVNIKGPKNG